MKIDTTGLIERQAEEVSYQVGNVYKSTKGNLFIALGSVKAKKTYAHGLVFNPQGEFVKCAQYIQDFVESRPLLGTCNIESLLNNLTIKWK